MPFLLLFSAAIGWLLEMQR